MKTEITLPDGTKKYLKEEMVEKLASRLIAIDTETCSYEVAAAIVKLVFPKDTEEFKQKLFDVYPYLEAYLHSKTEWNLVRNTTLRIVNVADFFEDNTVLPEQEVKPATMFPDRQYPAPTSIEEWAKMQQGFMFPIEILPYVVKALNAAVKDNDFQQFWPPAIPDEYKKVMEQMREVFQRILEEEYISRGIQLELIETENYSRSGAYVESLKHPDIQLFDNALAAYETLITNK